MRKELSGLELRKTLAEALGWRQGAGGCYGATPPGWHHPSCVCPDSADMEQCICYSEDDVNPSGCDMAGCAHFHNECSEDCPPFEVDPGAFWWVFQKWLSAVNQGKDFRADVFAGCELYGDGSADFQIIRRDDGEEVANEDGRTLLEAGCRAWLKALEKLNEEKRGSDEA